MTPQKLASHWLREVESMRRHMRKYVRGRRTKLACNLTSDLSGDEFDELRRYVHREHRRARKHVLNAQERLIRAEAKAEHMRVLVESLNSVALMRPEQVNAGCEMIWAAGRTKLQCRDQ